VDADAEDVRKGMRVLVSFPRRIFVSFDPKARMFRSSRQLATNVTAGRENVAIGRTSTAGAPRRCGGHVAVRGRDKYLTLYACGGVALGSQ
jgi:hypothetical protein